MTDRGRTIESAFASLSAYPADEVLGLLTRFEQDPRADKTDLGIGVYRDETGHTPIMAAVRAAEARLLQDRTTKSYLGSVGDVRFTDLLAKLALGADLAASPSFVAAQTPGGTGALSLGAALVARARPETTVWVGDPSWPNHVPILIEAGLRVRSHRFFDAPSATIDFGVMMADLASAVPGDVLLLHGCCHNPTGTTFTDRQWTRIAQLCNERGLIPFIDLAYQGFGTGLAEDATPTRLLLADVPTALVAYSCSKTFGLYRERTGALWLKAKTTRIAENALDHIRALARSFWSMPPDHGAAVVRTILENEDMRQSWECELTAMRSRLQGVRALVAQMHPTLSSIATQQGMFALLPLSGDQIAAMREQDGIYMMASGRINLCGLTAQSLPHFQSALVRHLPR